MAQTSSPAAHLTAESRRRGRAAGLTVRCGERDTPGRLISAVRSSESRALVLRGDLGVGIAAGPLPDQLFVGLAALSLL
jgi:hypothetical protein